MAAASSRCRDYVFANCFPLLAQAEATDALGHFLVSLTFRRHPGFHPMLLNLLHILLDLLLLTPWVCAFQAIYSGFDNLPETFIHDTACAALWAEISAKESIFFLQTDVEFIEQFWLVLSRYAPLPPDAGLLILRQMSGLFEAIEDNKEEVTDSMRSEMKGHAVEAAMAVFAANGDAWREIGGALLSVGRLIFDEIPFSSQRKLLSVMNWAYDFGNPDEMTVEMARLQMPFLDDEKMATKCLTNLVIAMKANPGNEELRGLLADEMSILEGCCESESEAIAALALELIAGLEGE